MADTKIPENIARGAGKTEVAAPPPKARIGEARAEYYNAREEGKRYNRNILQYAGAIAAVIGIGTGSGGILAVANAIDKGSLQLEIGVIYAVLSVAAGVAVALLAPLVFSFWRRGIAESRETSALGALMLEDPDFSPSE